MLGLLRKDLFNLSGQLKFYAFIPVIAMVFCLAQKSLNYAQVMMSILIIFVPLSAFAYDEMSNFNAYALTLPVTKKHIANAKYLLSLILVVLVILLACLIGLVASVLPIGVIISDWVEYVSVVVCVALVVNIINCVMLPLMFQYGSEKSRILLMIIFFGVGFLGYLINSMNLIDLTMFESVSTLMFCIGIAIVSIVVEGISLVISYKILEHKEF